jgi:hypothetical protein
VIGADVVPFVSVPSLGAGVAVADELPVVVAVVVPFWVAFGVGSGRPDAVPLTGGMTLEPTTRTTRTATTSGSGRMRRWTGL